MSLLSANDAASDEFAVVGGSSSSSVGGGGGGGGGGSGGIFTAPTFQGYLQKKSPRGFLGKHPWQRRFFLLENAALSYFKEKAHWARGEQPIGVIRVDMIRDIQVPVDSAYYGLRFDILAVGGHLFELMAPSEKSCTQWVRALRDEVATRHGSVKELLRNVKDEHVVDGYWKRGKDVKDMHAHAEKAVPVKPAAAGNSRHGRNGSSGAFSSPEEDEEARERAEALAVMMADEEKHKAQRAAAAAGGDEDSSNSSSTGIAGGIASVFQRKKKEASAPPSASSSPAMAPAPPSPTDPPAASVGAPALSAEERAQSFLKQQYTASKAAGGGRTRRGGAGSERETSGNAAAANAVTSPRSAVSAAAASDDFEPHSGGGGGAAPSSANGRSRSTSWAGDAAAAPPPPRRRMAYGDSDSDSENERTRRAAVIAGIRAGNSGAAAAATGSGDDESEDAGHIVVRVGDDSDGNDAAAAAASSAASVAAASPSHATASPSLSPHSSFGGPASASVATSASAEADDTPFISSVLWKESPTGVFKVWQKRLFALQDGAICYFRSVDQGLKETNLAGTIPIHQISKVALASGDSNLKKKQTDFNLFTTEGRIYKLRSESPEVTRQWIAFIQACDPRRLGTTYPGLVVREPKKQGSDAPIQAGGGVPARGRLMATSAPSGRVVVSVMPSVAGTNGAAAAGTGADSDSGGGSSNSRGARAAPASGGDRSGTEVTGPLPLTGDQAAAEEAIEERKSFSNFVRNKHSLLSIFFVKKKAAFPRSARLFLFTLDLLMNLFFVYVFINTQPQLHVVETVVYIIMILLAIEMVIGWGLREFCFARSLGPIEQQVRLAVCAILLYALFGSLTAWQWTLLPSRSAIMALVRFIFSSIGVVFAEIAVWYVVYSCAKGCCPCLTLDDGTRSLEDIAAEQEEQARQERAAKHQADIEARRAKMHKKLEVKQTRYREEDEV